MAAERLGRREDVLLVQEAGPVRLPGELRPSARAPRGHWRGRPLAVLQGRFVRRMVGRASGKDLTLSALLGFTVLERAPPASPRTSLPVAKRFLVHEAAGRVSHK